MAENQSPPATPPPLQGASSSSESDLLEPGEHVLTIIHRSVIGLVGIYLVAAAAVLAIFGVIIAISPDTFSSSGSEMSGTLMALVVSAAVLLVLILYAATYVYRQSRLLLTDRSLVQIIQRTLFNRKVSRLSMSNVEDVNAEQRGIIASLFNYGTLNVETAGEQENFTFTLCPNPNRIADQVIEARQRYAESLEEEHEAELAQHLKSIM